MNIFSQIYFLWFMYGFGGEIHADQNGDLTADLHSVREEY